MAGTSAPYERKKLIELLSFFDFAARPSSRAGWYFRAGAIVLALVALERRLDTTLSPMLRAKLPVPIPTEEIDDDRFRLPERIRREIFDQIAAAEIAERKRAMEANTWNGHLWSREDDRGHYERVLLRSLAAKYKVSLSQMYLILDEGIRRHWPGPDGRPLTGTTPPLNPRSTW